MPFRFINVWIHEIEMKNFNENSILRQKTRAEREGDWVVFHCYWVGMRSQSASQFCLDGVFWGRWPAPQCTTKDAFFQNARVKCAQSDLTQGSLCLCLEPWADLILYLIPAWELGLRPLEIQHRDAVCGILIFTTVQLWECVARHLGGAAVRWEDNLLSLSPRQGTFGMLFSLFCAGINFWNGSCHLEAIWNPSMK